MGNREEAKIPLTSLMDALTIILVFLLSNYSDMEQEYEVPDYIEMPTLYTEGLYPSYKNLTVLVGADRVQIGATLFTYKQFEKELPDILEKIGEAIGQAKEVIEKDEDNKGKPIVLAIQADKQIPYSTIDGIVLAAASTGITRFELVALTGQ
jgi:biopolymer transport protein ExbD